MVWRSCLIWSGRVVRAGRVPSAKRASAWKDSGSGALRRARLAAASRSRVASRVPRAQGPGAGLVHPLRQPGPGQSQPGRRLAGSGRQLERGPGGDPPANGRAFHRVGQPRPPHLPARRAAVARALRLRRHRGRGGGLPLRLPARARAQLVRLRARLATPGVDLDLEWGYGNHLPLDRWWTLGGPSFLMGTQTMGYLAPNFLVGRFGLPVQFPGPFGLPSRPFPGSTTACLAGDAGGPVPRRTGTRPPASCCAPSWPSSTWSLSYGLPAQPAIRPAAGAGPRASFNALIGTQPFDIWTRR